MKRRSQARQLGFGWRGEMHGEDVPRPQRERVLKTLRALLEQRAEEQEAQEEAEETSDD